MYIFQALTPLRSFIFSYFTLPVLVLANSTAQGVDEQRKQERNAKKKNCYIWNKTKKIFLNQFLYCKRGHQTEKNNIIFRVRVYSFISTYSRCDELTIAFLNEGKTKQEQFEALAFILIIRAIGFAIAFRCFFGLGFAIYTIVGNF